VHHKYNIGKVTIFPDFVSTDRTKVYTDTLNDKNSYTIIYNNKLKFKKEVLIRPIFFEPKKLFSQQDIEDTYKRYQSLRVFSNVNLDFKENSDTSSRTIDAYVKLTPLRKQSYSFEGEGTNSSGYFGIRGNVVYQNKNIFKGAEIFQAKTGLELKQLPNIITSSNQNATEKIKNVTFNTIEIGPELSLTIPQFYFPFIKPFFSKKAYPKTIFTVAYNYQQNNNYTRNISNASFAYNWHEGKYKQHTITPIDFNIIGVIKSDTFNNILEARKNPLLTQSYQNLLITAFKYSFTYNNQETYKKAHTIYLRLNAETSGNIPQLINSSRGAEKVLNDDKTSYSYRIFRGIPSLSALEQPYAQYAKIEIDYRNYFNFAENKNLVVRFDVGYAIAYDNSKSLPFVKSFIGGGTNDIRAWRARTLGPGVYNNSQATVVEKIGDIKFVSNIEYRYKVFKKLNAATFIDMGNIWLVKDSIKTGKAGAQLTANNFTNAMAIGGGFGLRYDFTFFIFRLDIAAKLRDPARLEGDRWVVLHKEFFNIGNFNFLNIGIGYPF
jgi:outer membrane protein assembly factor BamA